MVDNILEKLEWLGHDGSRLVAGNQVIYIDHFGNAITGIRAANLETDRRIAVTNQRLRWARTFSEVATGEAFWYQNSNGLVELAVNQGRADQILHLNVGDALTVLP